MCILYIYIYTYTLRAYRLDYIICTAVLHRMDGAKELFWHVAFFDTGVICLYSINYNVVFH